MACRRFNAVAPFALGIVKRLVRATQDVDFLIDRLERYITEECPRFLGSRMVNEDEVPRPVLTFEVSSRMGGLDIVQ